MKPVHVYLDFVSPYTYLALVQAEAFADTHGIRWRPTPVVYGAILDRIGLVGPVETEAKRRYTMRDIGRCAALLGVPLVGPPEHPFRSLSALRLLAAYHDDDVALSLATALATAAWARGRDLTDEDVLADVARRCGADRRPVPELIADPDIKRLLRDFTEDALERGVFGVPTFECDGELFWGHDRLDHLAARLEDRIDVDRDRTRAMERRPRGSQRRGAPAGGC